MKSCGKPSVLWAFRPRSCNDASAACENGLQLRSAIRNHPTEKNHQEIPIDIILVYSFRNGRDEDAIILWALRTSPSSQLIFTPAAEVANQTYCRLTMSRRG